MSASRIRVWPRRVSPATPRLMPMLARTDQRAVPVDLEGLGDGRQQPVGDAAGDAQVRAVLEQHRELVAAQPRRRVAAAQASRGCARRPRISSSSPASWPSVSLTVLKSSRSRNSTATLLAAPRQGVRQPVAEEGPVGEPGERVVERLPLELVLQLLPLAQRAAQLGDHGPSRPGPAGTGRWMPTAMTGTSMGLPQAPQQQHQRRHQRGRRQDSRRRRVKGAARGVASVTALIEGCRAARAKNRLPSSQPRRRGCRSRRPRGRRSTGSRGRPPASRSRPAPGR